MYNHLEFINFPKCYEGCGGYCCTGFKNNNFNFFSSEVMALPLLEKEYKQYIKSGGIKEKVELKKIEEFRLKNSRILKIYWLYCNAKGLCDPHENRPLICKLYPLLPKVDSSGKILDFFSASLFDLFYDKFSHPCLLISDSFEEVKEQLKISVKVLLDDPLYIFAFRVCYLLCEYLKEYLKKKFGSHFIADINRGEVQEFWQKVQWLLLTRKAWRNEKFYSEVCDIYDEIANVWGEFLPFE